MKASKDRKRPRVTAQSMQSGFALISAVMLTSFLFFVMIGMLTLSSTETRKAQSDGAMLEAKANAKLALTIALGQLQKYAGSDQRVTARADITDEDWTQLDSAKVNPYYTLVWDVSGSEMDFESVDGEMDLSHGNRRPGMDSGHDFAKKPAVLVSGNEAFSLVDQVGNWVGEAYPEGYITADSVLEQGSGDSITIVPAERILGKNAMSTGEVHAHSVTAPLVELENDGAYAWWIGDESIKARTNLSERHAMDSKPAQMMAQRSVIDFYQEGLSSVGVDKRKVDAMLSVANTPLAVSAPSGKSYSYSPDITAFSESILSDTRNGGLKKDMSYVLYRQEDAEGIPAELADSAPLLDRLDGRSFGGEPGLVTGNSDLGGLAPYVKYWREYAQQEAGEAGRAVSMGTGGMVPVMSQVQAGIHGAIQVVDGSKFQIYYGVYPAVTLWNPYSVPLKIDKKINVYMERRSGTSNWWLNLFRANYKIQRSDGSFYSNDGVFDNSQGGKGGWNFRLEIDAEEGVIPPGKAMVFTPQGMTIDSRPVASSPGESWKRTTHVIELKSGWRPGKGHLFALDGVTHDAKQFNPDGGSFPKIAIGMGGVATDNLLWFANFQDDQRVTQTLSYWSRLSAQMASETAFFAAPSVTDESQDTRGGFPGMLYKHALRMGDDYLITPSEAVHEEQLELHFPYMAHYNPRAIYHAGIGDSYTHNPHENKTKFYSSEGTESAPSLMGALYDYQNARTIYTIPTLSIAETFSYIGSGYLGSDAMVMAAPPVSLGEVRNAESGGIVSLVQLNHSNSFVGSRRATGALRYMWMGTSNLPAEPIGNSVGDFRLNLEHRRVSHSGVRHWGSMAKRDTQGWRVDSAHYDVSYLMNDMLYDRYFFSTIPQGSQYDAESPLVNGRMRVVNGLQDKLQSIDSAEYLRLLGGFNINSTSVPAWEMVLSSSLGVAGDGEHVSFSAYREFEDSKRLHEMDDIDAAAGDIRVTLTQSEIELLAQAVVREVKRRGPFPSVAAFVNRTNRLGDLLREEVNEGVARGHVEDVRYAGAIQSAIDAASLNKNVDGGNEVSSSDFVNDTRFYPGVGAVRKATSSHLPGSVKQSDILQQIDPMITARGDTFVIRTVGVSRDESGRVLAKAACEAVVQRGVDYLDASQSPAEEPYALEGGASGSKEFKEQLSASNKKFGRAFKVVDFKWLASSEVAQMEIHEVSK
ncbi:hypothetical protein [Rubritalea tangerina]|uniref:Uncharacterized protein n=1 Tax=Rubritalea tangerina TaxID=430798 RepID=A0ABW4ZFB1_9BACT